MCSVDQLIFKKPQMSVMRLGMHNKSWENMMSTSQLAYKMDRPAYSTPPPVENIPTNNECTMVDLRGSKVASFTLGCEEFICLPQAFDLFLKHLVGGLHTVYTKLKRLNITPVVCNVEQVRVLRGLGAIQPGVNRCKLITRKDFEILYQDCTTASRPGRPPKRYPTLAPTADLMSPHANLRGNSAFSPTDFPAIPKRMRYGPSLLDQQHEKRAAGSPTKDNEKSPTPLSLLSSDMHNNPCTNLAYLQQAIRQQYQQAAMSGLHNGLEPQQINPALNPFMMMSHPSLFSSGIPPTSMAMLNHINQMAQNHIATGGMSTVAAQLTAHGGKITQTPVSSGQTSSSGTNEKDSDGEEMHTPRSFENTLELSNGIGSDGRASPASSLGSPHGGMPGHLSDSCDQTHNPFSQTFKEEIGSKSGLNHLSDAMRELAPRMPRSSDDEAKPLENNNLSAMRTLLANIQGLIKVAADNACLQEKHASMEIAEIKLKLSQEKQLRELAEQKLHNCDKEKVEAEKRYYKEKKENKKLQGQIVSMQQILSHDTTSHNNDDELETSSHPASSPSSTGAASMDALSETSSSSANVTSPVTSSFSPNAFVARTPVCQAGGKSNPSSPLSGRLSISSVSTNINNNSNNLSFEDQMSPDHQERVVKQESKIPGAAIDLVRARNQHSAFQDQLNFFKSSSLLYQRAATQ